MSNYLHEFFSFCFPDEIALSDAEASGSESDSSTAVTASDYTTMNTDSTVTEHLLDTGDFGRLPLIVVSVHILYSSCGKKTTCV